MKLRRLEFAILAITLAFAFFMGGFFTGRSISAVSFNVASAQAEDKGVQIQVSGQPAAPAPLETVYTPDGNANAATPPPGTGAAEATQKTGAPKNSDGRININTATHGELTDLPGIGDALASRIIDYRNSNGGFAGIEDIQNVSGIGERRFEAIKDLICVE